MKWTFTLLCLLVFTVVWLVSAPAPARAQGFGGLSNVTASGVSYHEFAKAGEATVEVLVMGSGGSGIYILGVGTTLDQLLALIGGVPMTSTSNTQTRVTLRLFREEAGTRRLVYEAELTRLLTEPSAYPALQDGDVFTVEVESRVRRPFTWREGFFLFNSLVSAAFLIERIVGG